MLPSHPFRYPVCSPSEGVRGGGGGVQSIFQPKPEFSRGGGGGGGVETGSGLSPSEIVKRKLHQRLMAGQAKKRRLSSETAVFLPDLGPRHSDAGGGGNESGSGGDAKEKMMTVSMSMEDSSGSPLSPGVARLNKASNNGGILPNSTTSDLRFSIGASLPQSAGAVPFPAIFDTSMYASGSTVPSEDQPTQHIATSVEGFEVSVSTSTLTGSANASSAVEKLSIPAAVNSLGEIVRYSAEHQKVRKKKSRRPPKVKKIKFHEYKGPHRRTMAATQRLLSESNKKVKMENSVLIDSLPTSITSVAIENHRLNNNSNAVNPLNSAKPTIQNVRGTDALIAQEIVLTASQKIRQQIDMSDRSDRLIRFEKHGGSIVDSGLCPSMSKSPELKTCPAPQSNPTVKPANTAAPGAVRSVVQQIAQAGISAPLLVTAAAAAAAASRRKEKLPKADIIRATNVSEKKVLRKTSAVLTAPVTLDDLKVAELKEECKTRRMSVSGPKPRLVSRLMPFSDAILDKRRLPATDDVASKSKRLPPSTGKPVDCKATRSTLNGVPEFFQSISHQTETPTVNQKEEVHSVQKEIKTGDDNNDDDDDDDEEDDNDDNDYDDGDEGSTSSLCPKTVGTVRPTIVQRSQPRTGGDVIRGYNNRTVTSYADSTAATTTTTTDDRRRPEPTHPRPTTQQPETDASSGIQQQLLTPPTTPTLVPSSCVVGLQANCESIGATIDVGIIGGNNGAGGGGCGVGGGGGGGGGVGSRWLYHVTSNGVPVTVTDSELWTMQERQIADLQQQLQKTKAQLMCARMKARLDQCCTAAAAAAAVDYRLPPVAAVGALIGGDAAGADAARRGGRRRSVQQQQAKCLSEEARLALSSAIDNAERTFDCLKRDVREQKKKHPPVVDITSASPHHRHLSESIDFTTTTTATTASASSSSSSSPHLNSVPVHLNESGKTSASGDGGPPQPPTDTLGPDESNLEHQDYLYESSSEVNETSDSLATDSENEQQPVRGSWSIPPPARKPPDYYEAMRQKLMQSRSMLMAKEMEGEPRPAVAFLSAPSIDASLRPSVVASSKEEEEIEDVLEVLLRSGELNATEILPERLIWQQDPMANFTKEGRYTLAHQWQTPQNTKSQQQRLSDNDSYEGSECTPTGGAQLDSTMETILYKACRVTGGPGAMLSDESLGRNSAVKEDNPPSIELAELLFDWNDVENVNNRSNAGRPFDSYSLPDESILCPTLNRESIFADYSSLVMNGSQWTDDASDAIHGLLRVDGGGGWNAVTPCDSVNSSGCSSAIDDEGAVPSVDQRFLFDGKLGLLSPELTPPTTTTMTTVATDEAETERSFGGDALSTTDAYLRDAHRESEWMEEFVDSKNFHSPTHLTVINNPSSILSAFSFLQ